MWRPASALRATLSVPELVPPAQAQRRGELRPLFILVLIVFGHGPSWNQVWRKALMAVAGLGVARNDHFEQLFGRPTRLGRR